MGRLRIVRPSFFSRRPRSSGTTTSSGSSGQHTASSHTTTTLSSPDSQCGGAQVRKSASATKLRETFAERGAEVPEAVHEESLPGSLASSPDRLDVRPSGSDSKLATADTDERQLDLSEPQPSQPPVVTVEEATPVVDGEATAAPSSTYLEEQEQRAGGQRVTVDCSPRRASSTGSVFPRTQPSEKAVCRKQSITDGAHAHLVKTLVDVPAERASDRHHRVSTTLPPSAALDYFTPGLPDMGSVLHRKVWVRRPGASATLVQIREDDLVDDVREMILKKYANSLGRSIDAPDITLRIVTRVEQGHQAQRTERNLGPEEDMCRTIDSYYPGGQTVDEALVIDVPVAHKRCTPRPSPKVFHYSGYHAMDDYRPLENGTDYFPPMPAVIPASMPQTAGSHDSRGSQHHPSIAASNLEHHQRSISVLNTGQIAPLPSPGGRRHRSDREHRPKYVRQHTSSPTIMSHPSQPQHIPSNAGAVAINLPLPATSLAPLGHRASGRPRMDSTASEAPSGVPAPPPLPTPPAPEAAPTRKDGSGSTPPTPNQVVAPSHGGYRGPRPKKVRKPNPEISSSRGQHQRKGSQATASPTNGLIENINLLDRSVPPINVLIVEDNIINLRVLEGLMKRLKVRWQTAMNGQIAVDSWKKGGYHLVLMDIQMPVMNGLQATKEIRRLERVNGIGAFSDPASATSSPRSEKKIGGSIGGNVANGEGDAMEKAATGQDKRDADRLPSGEGLFKSPVIIVALTASNLQSDRHAALAAGCNDFLTKPVNFVWLERKVKEWGCMQALIDFDGWRKWKDYAAREEAGKSDQTREEERQKEEKQRIKMEKLAKLQEKQRQRKEEEEKAKKAKRQSVNASESNVAPLSVAAGNEEADVVANASAASEG